jgi:hypothetical protein
MTDRKTNNDEYFKALELLVKAAELPPGLGRDKLIAEALKLDPNAVVPPRPVRS